MNHPKKNRPIQRQGVTRGLLSVKEKRKPLVRLMLTLGSLLLVLGALAMIAPVVWMLLGSLKTSEEIYKLPQVYLPGRFRLDNYQEAWKLVDFAGYLLNSVIICSGTVLGQLLVCSMAAYSLSKLRVRFAGGILLLFMTSLMVPMEVLVIPLYLIVKHFPFGPGFEAWNLVNTYWAVILPGIFSAFAIMVLKEFFDSIPDDILYAARIDGCGEAWVFFRFILPMTKPILSFLAVFAFVGAWNSFFWPLIVLNNPDYYPLVLGVQRLVETGEPWNVALAALAISAVPPILLLALFQRAIIRGIAYTGIYG